MKKLKAVLKQKLENAARIAVLGIGSDLRGDDAAGIIAAQQIEKITGKNKLFPQLKVLIGATAPENLTGEIKQFKPSHLVIIDAADTNAPPGQIAIINTPDADGVTFCTHSLSPKVMIDYLLQSLPDLKVIIIGIQPKTIAVGSKVSKEVNKTVRQIASAIVDLLKINSP